jgi:hypothetical protein
MTLCNIVSGYQHYGETVKSLSYSGSEVAGSSRMFIREFSAQKIETAIFSKQL